MIDIQYSLARARFFKGFETHLPRGGNWSRHHWMPILFDILTSIWSKICNNTLQLSLIFADIVQGLGAATSLKWIHDGQVACSSYCTAQAKRFNEFNLSRSDVANFVKEEARAGPPPSCGGSTAAAWQRRPAWQLTFTHRRSRAFTLSVTTPLLHLPLTDYFPA